MRIGSIDQKTGRGLSRGKATEKAIQSGLEAIGAHVIRVPDGCRALGPKKLIRVKSPFDFIACWNGRTVLFDAKTTESSSLVYSKVNQNQLAQLWPAFEQGISAGYLVYFQKYDQYNFFNARQLRALKPRESLSADDCPALRDFSEIFS